MIGRGDKVHRDWIYSRGFKYSESLFPQIMPFGVGGFKALADLLEKEARVEDQ